MLKLHILCPFYWEIIFTIFNESDSIKAIVIGFQWVSKLPIAAVFETELEDNTGESVVKNGKNFNSHTFLIFY